MVFPGQLKGIKKAIFINMASEQAVSAVSKDNKVQIPVKVTIKKGSKLTFLIQFTVPEWEEETQG